MYVLIALIAFIMVLIITNIRIVPQSNAFVIERQGCIPRLPVISS